jgi:group I intron endonuclease
MKEYYVYKHTFPNGKVYIGITGQDVKRRWKSGYGYLEKKENGTYQQPLMARAVLKYGWNNILHEVLFDRLTREEAAKKEQELIAAYKSNDPKYGYNITIGGEGSSGKPMSEEVKKKISVTLGKPVTCVETGITYYSTKEAQDKTGINKSHIGSVCRGTRKTAGGYLWKYYEQIKEAA